MDALEAAGLTPNESKIYEFLLRTKRNSITEIAKRTGIHRRSVYDVVMRLADKGLITVMMEDKARIYQANDPSQLSRLMDERKKLIDKEIPELMQVFQQNAEKKSTQFLYGKKGIQAVLEDQLRAEKEVLVLGAGTAEILQHYMPKYHLIQAEKKMPMKMIYCGQLPKKKLPFVQLKSFPKVTEVAINIYGNNVAFLLWKKDNPFAILIRDEDVAKSFRTYFDFIWNSV